MAIFPEYSVNLFSCLMRDLLLRDKQKNYSFILYEEIDKENQVFVIIDDEDINIEKLIELDELWGYHSKLNSNITFYEVGLLAKIKIQQYSFVTTEYTFSMQMNMQIYLIVS